MEIITKQEAEKREQEDAIRALDLDRINPSILSKSESALIAERVRQALCAVGLAAKQAAENMRFARRRLVVK